jgi:hypothetical protein
VRRLAKSFPFATNGYDPVTGAYTPPSPEPNAPPDPWYSDLADAFERAPPYFAAELCTEVQYVFIDPFTQYDVAPFGWAYWEVKNLPLDSKGKQQQDQGNGTGRWIAVGQRVWDSAETLAGLEESILQYLLGVGPVPPLVYGQIQVAPSTAPAPGEPEILALVAILAREMGFIINFNHDVATSKICDGNTFASISWKPNKPFSQKGRIHRIGDEANPAFIDHKRSFKLPTEIKKLYDSIPSLDHVNAAAELARIYGVPPPVEWANLLADTTPDDDFIETYRMVTLINSGLGSLTVPFATISPTSANVVDNFRNGGRPLADKVKCIRNNFAK